MKIIIVVCITVIIIFCNSCGKKQMESEKVTTDKNTEQKTTTKNIEYYSEDDILQVRKKFEVKIIEFDAKKEYGTEFPYSDRVLLRITNNSKIVLPYLTIKVKRYNNQGEMIGFSRSSIPASNIKPGESLEYEDYPRGHLFGVKEIKIEIEHIISDDTKQFFKELNEKIPKQKWRFIFDSWEVMKT